MHVTLSAAPGGRREAILSLAAGLRAAGISTHLVCLECLGSPIDQLRKAFDTVQVLDRWSIYRLSAVRQLDRLCRLLDVGIIHTHDAASQFAAALLRAVGRRTRLVTTFHRTLGFESARIRDRVRNAIAGLVTGAVIVGSTERRAHYLARNWVGRRKVIHIPFGVDLTRFRPNPETRATARANLGVSEDTILIGAVGHFGRVKGLDVAVRAFDALLRRQPARPARLVVVGRGTPAEESCLRALARRAPNGSVSFAGFREVVEQDLAALDVFLHTPRAEAFGLVVAEAMATGLPVVAAGVGGVVDLVRPQQTGILVPPEDPDATADALAFLVADDGERTRLGREARRVATEEYGLDLYAARHVALYNDVLDRPA
jgi:L-malate glycosyltransferase